MTTSLKKENSRRTSLSGQLSNSLPNRVIPMSTATIFTGGTKIFSLKMTCARFFRLGMKKAG